MVNCITISICKCNHFDWDMQIIDREIVIDEVEWFSNANRPEIQL